MPLRDDLLTPIPGDNPSGANLRYDPVVDKIKEARREDLDIPQGDWKTTLKTADHNAAIKLLGETIAKRSKDLQLAVWLVDSHVKKEKFPIIGQCFGMLHDMVDRFWDTLYPELEEDDLEIRAAPLEWLGTKLEEPIRRIPLNRVGHNFLQYKDSRLVGYEEAAQDDEDKLNARNAKINDGKLPPEDFDSGCDETPKQFYEDSVKFVDSALTELEGLNEICQEKFGYDAPSFSKTREALDDVRGVLNTVLNKKGGATVVEEPPPVEDEFTSFLSKPVPPAAVPVEDDFSFRFDAIGGSPEPEPEPEPPARSRGGMSFSADGDPVPMLAAIAKRIRENDRNDPAAYLMLRGFRFGELWQNAPPIREEKLEPPPTEMRIQLRQYFNQSFFDELVDACEEAMEHPCSRGWLDLHRMSVIALDNMLLRCASAAVTSFVKALITDLPEIKDATFTDGTPCCSAETKEWIEQIMPPPPAAVAPAAAASEAAPAGGGDDFSFSFDTPAADTPAAGGGDFSFSFDTPAADTPAAGGDDAFNFDSFSFDTPAADAGGAAPAGGGDDAFNFDSFSFDTPATPAAGAPAAASDDPFNFDSFSFDSPGDIPAAAAATTASAAPAAAKPNLAVEDEPPILVDTLVFPPPAPEALDDFGRASKEVKEGRPAEGMRIITELLAVENSGRKRFRRRTQLAHLLIMAGHHSIAVAMLEELEREIVDRKLEDWEEAEAVAYPLELLVKCTATDQAERRSQLFARLSRIDPVRAMNCAN